MRRSKDKFYKRQIFDCLMEGKVVAAGEITQEVGLSEKSVRNKLDGMNEFLLQKKSSASRGWGYGWRLLMNRKKRFKQF